MCIRDSSLPPSAGSGKVVDMGYLYDIAQRHLDAYGVRASALARRMGTSPQTLDSWKHRGLKQLPEKWLLEALARETRTPYGVVLTAVLRDTDYLPREREGDGHQPAAKSEAEETSAQDAANDMAARGRAESTDSEAPGRAPHSHTQSGAKRRRSTRRDGGTAESTTP